MANRKTKSVAVTGVTGVTGIFDELYARGREGVGEETGPLTRAHNVDGNGGDTGDSGDSYLDSSKNKVENEAEGVTGQNLDGGDTGDRQSAEADPVPGLDIPVAQWADLPAPASLRVRTATGRAVWFTASRKRLSEASSAREAAFGPNEYEAAVVAVREGRATLADLDRWIDRKLSTPDWRLTAIAALGGAVGLLREPLSSRVRPDLLGAVPWSTALVWLSCTALEVVVEDAPITANVAKGEEFSSL